METVTVVSMGYNDLRSYLGIFESREKAEKFLLEIGCRKDPISYPIYNGDDRVGYKTVDKIVPTEEFTDWLQNNVGFCSFYSVGADFIKEKIPFIFETVEFNKIVRGYNDD